MSDTAITINIEPLDQDHDRGVFCCGVKFIDHFIAKKCLDTHDRYKARVYVATEQGAKNVIGFYTLSLTAIKPQETSPEEAHEKFGAWVVPLVYLGQIGVHEAFQKGKGVGSALMLHAFERTLQIAEIAGTFGLALDAIDEERATWYEKIGFTRFDIEPDGRIKMLCPLTTIRAALEAV